MISIPGIVGISVFYFLILIVGIWAARKSKKNTSGLTDTENVMLAGRDIGLLVGIFTMTATWVGGGYINGTAESVYNPTLGLINSLAPVGYALSLVVGGLFFANIMRRNGYVTMLDPLQAKYGKVMCGLLFIPALLGEIFWSAAILSALGATINVVIGLRIEISVIVSACIALLYTLIGGLYSVAYTDVIQLICIFFGLWISVPFAMNNAAVSSLSSNSSRWIGTVEPSNAGIYADDLLMLILGGVPWQVYFQRVLSSRTVKGAQILSYCAGFGCLVMAVPAILIGAIGANTDWTAVGYNNTINNIIPEADRKLVLPLVLRYLCPPAVVFVGLGAISAAVMSSADSSIFSAASMFTRNVFQPICGQKASESLLAWVMRAAILLVGILACGMGIWIESVYVLWFLCSDLVYVILFPQLVSVLYIPFSNTYGSLTGYCAGLFLRLMAGEGNLGIPPVIKYPYFDYSNNAQKSPIRTIAMLGSLLSSTIISYITYRLWRSGKFTKNQDIFKCFAKSTYQDDIDLDKTATLMKSDIVRNEIDAETNFL